MLKFLEPATIGSHKLLESGDESWRYHSRFSNLTRAYGNNGRRPRQKLVLAYYIILGFLLDDINFITASDFSDCSLLLRRSVSASILNLIKLGRRRLRSLPICFRP